MKLNIGLKGKYLEILEMDLRIKIKGTIIGLKVKQLIFVKVDCRFKTKFLDQIKFRLSIENLITIRFK